ncbi:MAG TPA: phage tail tape measure protein, partial [Lachnospiraceae bacterium]|nr:phage tail tape measure protein [Lachnospiraceae bacterium]
MSKAGVKVGKDIVKAGDQIAKVGAGLTTAVTVPLAGMAAASYKNFESVDKQLSLVRATMGDTAYATADLSEELAAAMTTSIFSMDEGAAALVNYARQGWNAREAADMLRPSLDLAAGTTTDLDAVTAGLGNTLKAFGASSDEATHYSDMFTKAQAQANTTVQGLFDAMSIAGPIAKTVGWSFSDIATLTGVFGDASIDASEGANALKTGLARLAAPAKPAREALEKLGIAGELFENGSLKSMPETLGILQGAFSGLSDEEKLASASAIFGKNQMS